MIASSSWPVEGRRPAAADDDRAGLLEQRGQARPAATATTRRPVRVAAGRPGACCGDLVGEVGDPDRCGRPASMPGLDRGADVVDVDVDVPQAARRRRRPGESPSAASVARSAAIAPVVGVEEVHHLVRRAVRR